MTIKDPNEIVARLYPTSTVAAGAGMSLTIRQPDGTNAVYNGSNAVTADARPKTLTINAPKGTQTYNGSAPTTIDTTLERLELVMPDGTVARYDGSGLSRIALPTTLPPTPGTLRFADFTLADKLRWAYVVSAAEVAKQLDTQPFCVTDYGATGDGTTDDGRSIQHCIDAAKATGLSTIIRFPAGTYNVTRTIFYYSNMTFFLEDGAHVRLMNDGQTAVPSVIFAPYFDTNIAYLSNGTDQRYAVENVRFIGGKISGEEYNNGTVSEHAMAVLTALCRNIEFVGVHFGTNAGGHAIEINSSTDVTVRDCVFEGYISDSSVFHECVQIDAATCTAIGSLLTIQDYSDGLYTYTRHAGTEGINYRMLGGYEDFTLLPPGDQYVNAWAQPLINQKLAALDHVDSYTNAQIRAMPGFHQCCHNITIRDCYFENTEGASCCVSAVGSHTGFDGGTEAYANQNQDKHTGIFIHGNIFKWPMNHATGAAATARGVIAFGYATGSASNNNYNAHVQTCAISNNHFVGVGIQGDFAISAIRSGSRHTGTDADFPQTKYRIFDNLFENIEGWTAPEDDSIIVLHNWDATSSDPAKAINDDFMQTASGVTVELYKVIKYRQRIHGTIAFRNIAIGSNGRGNAATLKQAYRPFAPRIMPLTNETMNSPVHGYFRTTDGGAYSPVSGYISAGHSTSSFALCTGVSGAIDRAVVYFDYPLG